MNNLLEKIFKLNRLNKIAIQIISDAILISFCFFLSMAVRLNNIDFIKDLNNWKLLSLVIISTIFIYFILGFYKAIIRYISEKILVTVGIAVLCSGFSLYTFSFFLEIFIPRSVPFIYLSFLFIATSGTRFIFKNIYLIYKYDKRKPVIIYGAGSTGRQIVDYLNESLEYKPIFFVDDNKNLFKTKINELNVYNFKTLDYLSKRYKVKSIILAMPNHSLDNKQRLIKKLERNKFEVKTVSDKDSFINSGIKTFNISSLSLQEILGRDEIPPIKNLLNKNIFSKNILITGAGGSIGTELCNQILNLLPNKIICLESSEFALYQIQERLNKVLIQKSLNLDISYMLGSIQDDLFLQSIFKTTKIDTIFHTAAYKHVPIIEENIIEGIKNNIIGTKNLCDLSLRYHVKNFILISSDKAVRPTNYMGITKRVSELICQAKSKTKNITNFSIVRFGNVIGSSGSVIPKFQKQINSGGPVSVTDKNITRYFMSIKEAAGLVIQAGALGESGDVFVLDMGVPVNIMDLAKRMIKLNGYEPDESENIIYDKTLKIKIKFTGLRKGEKLHEELFIGNKIFKTQHPRILKSKEKIISNTKIETFLKQLQIISKKRDVVSMRKLLMSLSKEFKI